MNKTDDPELNEAKRKKLEAELARISKNADRRMQREKLKGNKHAGSPTTGASPGGLSDVNGATSTADGTPQKGRGRNKDGTARKCANCGQVGHIKTNRKSVTKFNCLYCESQDYIPLVSGSGRSNGGGRKSAVTAGAESTTAAAGTFAKDSYSKFIL